MYLVSASSKSICKSSREAGSGGGGGQGGGAESGPTRGVCDGAVQQHNFHGYTREQKRQTEAAAAVGILVSPQVNWGEPFIRGILNAFSSYAIVCAQHKV